MSLDVAFADFRVDVTFSVEGMHARCAECALCSSDSDHLYKLPEARQDLVASRGS